MEYKVKELIKKLHRYEESLWIDSKQKKLVSSNEITNENMRNTLQVSSIFPEKLGCETFRRQHGTKFAYVAGAMAGGISSTHLVIAMAKSGCLGFFGAGGMDIEEIKNAISEIQENITGENYGFNLLHNPFEPHIEEKTVELYLKKGVHRISAAAYVMLTPYLVYYRVKGLRRDENGNVIPQNHIFAKISRSEVAQRFMSPAPKDILKELLIQGKITEEEAQLSQEIPMAEDITAESDSGGHTDKRPFVTLLPAILSLRDTMMEKYNYTRNIRVGAAGGISTPHSIAGAFCFGADYVLTGSINQACIEAGTSEAVKEMLSTAKTHDVKMAPSADMFERGSQVQVLKFGTMFAMRAEKLYELYQKYQSIDELSEKDRTFLETKLLKKTAEQIWDETVSFFETRDPKQIEKANKNPKHKMALIFRWYLGKSSRWARIGDTTRKMDYQIWMGPSMGSFNEWTKGTFLEKPENRKAGVVAHNLLRGACILLRVNYLKSQGFPLPSSAYNIKAVELDLLK